MRSTNGAVRRRGLAPVLIAVAIAALLGGPIGRGAAGHQAETPVIPPPPADAAAPVEDATTPVPAPGPGSGVEVDAGAPHLQTVAQGVVSLDGPMVWRVRQVEASTDGAAGGTAGTAFFLQREGVSVVRAGEPGRRVRLEAGEAGFVTSDDDVEQTAVGSEPSRAWVVELVAPNAQAGEGLGAGTVLFTSDIIDSYPAGTVEVELRRSVLLGNEVATLPAANGSALVMVTSGRVQATPDRGEAEPLETGVGRLETGSLTLRNPDAQPAVVIVAAVGEVLEAAEAPAAAAAADSDADADGEGAEPTPAAESDTAGADGAPEAPAAEDAAPSEPDPAEAGQETAAEAAPAPAPALAPTEGDTDGDGLSDADEAIYGSDPLNADYDADGLADGLEVAQYGSDPVNNDSDGDGLLDGDEVNQFGSNPASTDGDGDGLTDDEELFTHGTGPASFDSDGDGIGDGEEVLIYGTEPTDAASAP